MEKLTISDEELRQEFEQIFEVWAEGNAPPGDKLALRSLALTWFLKGHQSSTQLTARVLDRFGKEAFETAAVLRDGQRRWAM